MSASASNAVLAPPSFVLLKGGLAVPIEALQLAWSLEDRGAVLSADDADLVVDLPAGRLTETDRAAIRRWKSHLMAIATYRAPDAEGLF